MEFFRHYLVAPSKSAVVNIKTLLLTYGLNCDFDSIIKNFPFINKQYKVNQVRVSDRHLIAPKSKFRNYLPDEIMIADKFINSVVKVYYKKESPFILKTKNKKFYLYIKKNNTKLPVKVNLLKLLNYAKLDYKGYKLSEFISVIGLDRISILPFEGCEHWTIGKQCKFCGANPARIKFRKYKPNVYEINLSLKEIIQGGGKKEKILLFKRQKKRLLIC